jgi:hypothetical protein
MYHTRCLWHVVRTDEHLVANLIFDTSPHLKHQLPVQATAVALSLHLSATDGRALVHAVKKIGTAHQEGRACIPPDVETQVATIINKSRTFAAGCAYHRPLQEYSICENILYARVGGSGTRDAAPCPLHL